MLMKKVLVLIFILGVTHSILQTRYDKTDYLAKCVLETSKKIFPKRQTIQMFLNTIQYIKNKSDNLDAGTRFGDALKTKEFNTSKNPICTGMKTSVRSMQLNLSMLENLPFSPKTITIDEDINDSIASILSHLQQTSEWSINISPGSELNTQGNILIVRNSRQEPLQLQNELNRFIRKQKLFCTFNNKIPILVIIIGDSAIREQVVNVLKTLKARLNTEDVTLLVQNSELGVTDVLTWLPYEHPFGQCGKIGDVLLLGKCIKDHLILHSNAYQNKIPKYIHNCCFTIVTDAGNDFVRMINLRISQTINDFLKVPQKYCLSSNTTINISDKEHMISRCASTLISHYLYTQRLVFFIPITEEHIQWTSFTRVFSTASWVFTFASILFSAIILRCFAQPSFLNEFSSYQNVGQCLMRSWAIILGVGVDTMPRSTPLRVFFASWVLFSFSVVTVFLAFVTRDAIEPGSPKQISSLQELVDLDYKLLFHGFSPFNKESKFHDVRDRCYSFVSLDDALSVASHTTQTALVTSEAMFTYSIVRLCEVSDTPSFYAFSDILAEEYRSFFTAGNPLLQEILNGFVDRMVEAGLPEKFVKDISDPTGHRRGIGIQSGFEDNYAPLSIKHMRTSFYLLFLGLGLSVVIFFGEILLKQSIRFFRVVNLC